MQKLMNGSTVIAESETPIVYDEKEKGWRVGNAVYVDTDKLFSVSGNKVSIPTFKLLFSSDERIAIYASQDAAVKDFLTVLDDPRTTEVDFSLQSVQGMFSHLVTLNLLTEQRKNEILTGVLV